MGGLDWLLVLSRDGTVLGFRGRTARLIGTRLDERDDARRI